MSSSAARAVSSAPRFATICVPDRHEVVRLVRRPAAGLGERAWDPDSGRLDPAVMDGIDAVINALEG